MLKVFSASQQEETLAETPVPVTVITSEMIRAIGADNLQQVLATYVPGMTIATDQNELNVAMHGAYGSSQQKILILLDGHRLNGRAYSEANPNYSISLDKVRQIEVLRGPGSSLYGNVALTAVINIVTKSGREVDGMTVKGGLGNFGQQTASFLFGKEFEGGADVLVWANIFKSDGERRFIPASKDFSSAPVDGYAILNGNKDPPSHDLGVRLKVGDFTIMGNTRLGKTIEPFTSGGVTGETYDYYSKRTFEGVGPGLASDSGHLDLKYSKSFSDNFDLDVSGYYDSNQIRAVVTGPPSSAVFLSWNDDDVGVIAQGRYSYQFGPQWAGNLTLGGQWDRMELLDSILPSMTGTEWTKIADSSSNRLLELGNESIYSGFVQLKQHLGKWLIANIGARYDYKVRHRGANFQNVSPRAALIFTPSDVFDAKLSYAESFVDAPYWYRYNTLSSYRGASTLLPERLRSLQFTPSVTLFNGRLKNTVNVFYNSFYDLVFRNNNATPDQPIYQNTPPMRTVGVEDELSLILTAFKARGNLTYQNALKGPDVLTRDGYIYNIPPFVSNLVLDFNPFYALTSKTWFSSTFHYISHQLSPLNINFRNPTNGPIVASFVDPNNFVPFAFIWDVGFRVVDVMMGPFSASVDATVNNILNRQYQQGGSTVHPYPMPGRWYLLTLTFHIPV